MELGNQRLVNTILQGVLSNYMPFEKADWQEALKTKVKTRLVDLNPTAHDRGREFTRETVSL